MSLPADILEELVDVDKATKKEWPKSDDNSALYREIGRKLWRTHLNTLKLQVTDHFKEQGKSKLEATMKAWLWLRRHWDKNKDTIREHASQLEYDRRKETLAKKAEKREAATIEEKVTTTWELPTEDDPDIGAAVRWVVQVMGNKRIQPKDAPSAMAAGLLEMFRETPAAGRDLLKSLLPRMLPKTDVEQERRAFLDDGGTLTILERLSGKSTELMESTRKARTVECPFCGTEVECPESHKSPGDQLVAPSKQAN